MPDISEILKKAKRRQKSAFLCLDGELVAELAAAERRLVEVNGGPSWEPDSLASEDPRVALAKTVSAIREKVRKSQVEFRFQALGDREWSDLLAAHPAPDKDQRWDPATYPTALIAACAVDPVMKPEQVAELFEVINEGQRDELFQAAYEANTETAGVPFSLLGSGILEALTAGK